MPILLYGLGALCVLVGAFFAWLGLPDREFSFGNTLILTGCVSVVGGLIIIGLGAVVSHLRQLIELSAGQPAAQPRRSVEAFEAPSGRPPAGRIPFPPKPKVEARPPAAMPAELPPKAEPVAVAVPTLPNPDEPLTEVAEQAPPPPPEPVVETMAEPPVAPPLDFRDEPLKEIEPQEGFDREWPAPPPPPPAPERRSLFGFGRSERKVVEDLPRLDEMPPEPEMPPAPPAPEPVAEFEPPAAVESTPEPPRDVAILKSGVVDGMGYTLYVDGSIEAELPQGTLRFASINELRQHLEQNT